jgi:predicted permease
MGGTLRLVHTERGFDRIVNFSDATVAIAMTLLVLPLVDFGGETGEHDSLWELLSENYTAIFAFVLSFLVIWSMWVNHHRVMEYFADYDSRVLFLHLGPALRRRHRREPHRPAAQSRGRGLSAHAARIAASSR